MTCQDTQTLAANYLDGELPEEMSERIQRHLLRCAPCRNEAESLRVAVQVLQSAHRSVQPDPEYVASALLTLRRELDCVTRLPEPPGQLVLGIGH